MKSVRTIYLFVIAVVIIPVAVYGITIWYDAHIKKLPVFGPENHTVGDFRFRDQRNQEISLKDWNNKVVVAGYFFTSCPSICPKVIAQLKRVQSDNMQNVVISCFSVDPERDSVGRLKIYADKQGISWFLLTGNKIGLYKF
ncbi:MAG TPA: SCO family protein, partial [Puia sp.]|nr:SCO family protein [Puia sp.]